VVSHRNNFDLLRLVFAFMVVLVHADVLSRQPELAVLSRWVSAELAIESFFVVSGFLVMMSYEKSHSVGEYVSNRFRRIYPAYLVVVLGAALAGALITRLGPAEYFSSAAWLRYVAANLVFLNFLAPTLPGVFESNPISAVNGALWTLKIEVAFYASVPLIGLLCTKVGRAASLAGLYLLSVAYHLGMEYAAQRTGREFYLVLARQIPGQLAFFIAGAAGYYYLERLKGRWWLLAPLSVVLLVAPLPRAAGLAVWPAALGMLVVYLAVGLRYLGNFGRYGDFSYGIYIIHFPVIQTLVALGLFASNPWGAFALTTAIVLGGALLSWHFVEKPFLKRSSHYVVATRSHPPT
jgi:peptidoglycan/LPS O-acetylase OafA/YrhL